MSTEITDDDIHFGKEISHLRLVGHSVIPDRACKQLLGLPGYLAKGILALLQREVRPVCTTAGQIRWSMSVKLLSESSQITPVELSRR